MEALARRQEREHRLRELRHAAEELESARARLLRVKYGDIADLVDIALLEARSLASTLEWIQRVTAGGDRG